MHARNADSGSSRVLTYVLRFLLYPYHCRMIRENSIKSLLEANHTKVKNMETRV